jgi:hypothetical protein
MSRPDFFDTLPESKPSMSKFYVAMKKDDPLPEWLQKLHPEVRMVKNVSSNLIVSEVTVK